MEVISDYPMNRAGGLRKSKARREDVVEVRCPRLFLPRVAFASLSASFCVMLGRRSLHRKDLNGSKGKNGRIRRVREKNDHFLLAF